MNREQRRKNKITYTKQDLQKVHEEGFKQGFKLGIEKGVEEIVGVLRKDFGFGRKRLARINEAINRKDDAE